MPPLGQYDMAMHVHERKHHVGSMQKILPSKAGTPIGATAVACDPLCLAIVSRYAPWIACHSMAMTVSLERRSSTSSVQPEEALQPEVGSSPAPRIVRLPLVYYVGIHDCRSLRRVFMTHGG